MRRNGLVILPARMQEVQTLTRLFDPFTTARTRWIFGFQRRLVRRCECDTFIPKPGCFPQISQTAAMMNPPPHSKFVCPRHTTATERLSQICPDGRLARIPSLPMALHTAWNRCVAKRRCGLAPSIISLSLPSLPFLSLSLPFRSGEGDRP